MNNAKITTLGDKINAAIRAFKGQQIGRLTFGVDIKKCNECEYRNPVNWPDFHDFDVGTDHAGKYFLSLHNGYDDDAEEDCSALGVFTLDQVKTLTSNLRYIIGEEED